jgi:hypothetical protein
MPNYQSTYASPHLRLNDRALQFEALVHRIAAGEVDTLKPNKVLIHEARQTFPRLTARDIEVAFCIVRDKRPGRPPGKK